MRIALRLGLLAICLDLAASTAVGAAPTASGPRPELEATLSQRYQLTDVGPGMLGLRGGETSIRRAGGVVTVQQEGLYGSLERNLAASMNIQEGAVVVFRGRKDYAFAVGDRLYVHALYAGSDVISVGLVSAAPVTTNTGAGRVWATVNFFFPVAVLDKSDVNTIFRTLDQWLLPAGQQPVAYEAAPAPAAQVELKPGMNGEEVQALLGKPRRTVQFGTRVWLSYPGLIVLLEEGQLRSVDSSGQPPAQVQVRSEPDGGEIYLDGRFVGSTPATLEVPAGPHTVSVRWRGQPEWKRELEALAGSQVSLQARPGE